MIGLISIRETTHLLHGLSCMS